MISFYYFFRILCSANPTNVTFSDDDEQFVEYQSFNDLSHKTASVNTTIVSEIVQLNNSGSNRTVSEEAENKSAIFVDQANVTQDLGTAFSGGANETFDAIAQYNGDKHDSQQLADKFTSFTVGEQDQAREEQKFNSTDEEVPKVSMAEVSEPFAAQTAELIVDNISSLPEKPFECEDKQNFGDAAVNAGDFIEQEKLCLQEVLDF
jgi:hypothetical protein